MRSGSFQPRISHTTRKQVARILLGEVNWPPRLEGSPNPCSLALACDGRSLSTYEGTWLSQCAKGLAEDYSSHHERDGHRENRCEQPARLTNTLFHQTSPVICNQTTVIKSGCSGRPAWQDQCVLGSDLGPTSTRPKPCAGNVSTRPKFEFGRGKPSEAGTDEHHNVQP